MDTNSREPRSFSRSAIDSVSSKHLTAEEAKYLKQRFFPKEPAPTWKESLGKAARELQFRRVQDNRWRYITGGADLVGAMERPYKIPRSQLYFMAGLRPPHKFCPAVTSFTGWIHNLYDPVQESERLVTGREGERARARLLAGCPRSAEWDLVYVGTQESKEAALPISALEIGGVPMRAKPDYVFRERNTGRIVILEVKTFNGIVLPASCWPDARAQIWAYSKIDRWAEASDVTLAIEVWSYRRLTTGEQRVGLRRTYRWNRLDPSLEKECSALFDIYRHGVMDKGLHAPYL